MSGTFPSNPPPASVDITSMSPTFVSSSHAMKRQVRRRGGGVHRWAISLSWDPMTRAEIAPQSAFIIKQGGQYESFIYNPPAVVMEALGDYSGSVIVNGAHSAGDNTIAVSGSSGTLLADSWVTFANHTKMYKVVEDSTATLTIHPPLQEDVADTTAVTYDSPSFTVAAVSDNFSFSVAPPALYKFSLSLIEDY